MIYNDVNVYQGEDDYLREVMLAAKNIYHEGFKDGQKTNSDKDYERGLNDAWELVKRLHEMYVSEREKIFGTVCVIEELTPRDAVEKLKIYDSKHIYDEFDNIKKEYYKWIEEGFTPEMLCDILDEISGED